MPPTAELGFGSCAACSCPALGVWVLVWGAAGVWFFGPVPGLRSAGGTGRTGRFTDSGPGSAVRAASGGNLHHGRDSPVRSANLMGFDRHDGRSSCRSREPVAECHVGKVCRVHAGKCLFGHPEGLQRAVDDEPVVTGLCAEPSVPVDPVRVCGESREGDQGELVHVDAVRYRGLEGGSTRCWAGAGRSDGAGLGAAPDPVGEGRSAGAEFGAASDPMGEGRAEVA